jgi:hypothetical protein
VRFAAIADVHGNCIALEAVLADIAALGITEIVNLGDHVSGPLEARRTADLLIERGILSICGVKIDGCSNCTRRAQHPTASITSSWSADTSIGWPVFSLR